MNRRHLLLGGSAIAASSLIGSSCQSRTPPSTPTADTSAQTPTETSTETPTSETPTLEAPMETPTTLPTVDASVQAGMAERVLAWLQALTPEQQQRAVFPFNSDERSNWHYTPRSRQGIPFKEMSADQRQVCDRLLQFTLSETGYQKFQNIVTLETVLQQMGGSASIRDPELY
ncbi:MAG: DUF3500 domain-containing protein, partial [Leptolyngbyaceae bacterium]|nr:DUF3500 domain-containing protein [Leptolyngbyaceae bacterium]